MTICVFIGPSLPVAEARKRLDATYLPPVRQGDVYRAVARLRPRIVAIVDGYFQRVPSVWDKEILWAMDRGVRVAGAASMGALRAAELHRFGMLGVGRVFDAYRSGCFEPYATAFEDDDEVAVIHGPAETGYLAVSEAMVNIRATLAEAHRAGVVGARTRDRLVELAKRTYYPERSFEGLLAAGHEAGTQAAELEALRGWLPAGRVDQKREDARALLAALAAPDALDGRPAERGDAHFEITEIWSNAARAMDAELAATHRPAAALVDELVVDELRLEGERCLDARRQALERLAMLSGPAARESPVDGDALRRGSDALRRTHRLLDRESVDRWLADNELALEDYDRLVENEVTAARLRPTLEQALAPHLVDHLRLRGDYVRLAARARRKRELLAACPVHVEAPPAEALVAWHFERLGNAVPEDVAGHAERLGYAHGDAFLQALAREFAYVEASRRAEGDQSRPRCGAGHDTGQDTGRDGD